MRSQIDQGILGDLRRRLAELEKSMEGRSGFAGHYLARELSMDVAQTIEKWTEENLPDLLPLDDVDSIGRVLGEIHRVISGADDVRVSTGHRSITIDVRGCRDFDLCPMREKGSAYVGCPADMIVAAILQKAMDTPVRVRIEGGERYCRQVFSPAWLVDLLKDLDRLGAEGLVVTCSERILFTHLPTEAQALALSETVMMNEERPPESRERVVRYTEHRDIRLLLLNYGTVFVSVCLQPGAQEEMIAERIAAAVERELRDAATSL
jgi:hypothetical protein